MTISRKYSRQSGFSLSEVIVATAIFAVIFVAALMIYDRSNKVFKTSVESADMQQSARVGFDKLAKDLRMAGFDADRDGIPALGSGTQQQPDEQIEYAGTSAITIRGNLDFNTDVTQEHGRENTAGNNYEPAGGQFPIVTTGNDEIVTYALKSNATDANWNTQSIDFYADVAIPRKAYTGGGGAAETKVTISGIDTTNAHPPYTLYRFVVQADGTADAGTPIADNIRSLNFTYYTDAAGRTLLTSSAGAAIAQGAIAGEGAYDPALANPATAANFADRDRRSTIESIRVNLVGMNPNPDPSYNNPNETDVNLKRYRTYALQSLIVPRNFGMSGAAELNSEVPGEPTINSVCIGHCGIASVTWAAPTSGGAAYSYQILVSTNSSGPFVTTGPPVQSFSGTAGGLLPGVPYYFKVLAINDDGKTQSQNMLNATPINKTRPAAPTLLTATNNGTNEITLSWKAPLQNTLNTLSCTGTGGSTDGTNINFSEPIRYRIWRGTTQGFDITSADTALVLDSTVAPSLQPTSLPGATLSWKDDLNALGGPPVNCKQYYYRIKTYDTCAITPSHNEGGDATVGISTASEPAGGTNAVAGNSTSTVAPSVPARPAVVADPLQTFCNDQTNKCTTTLTWAKVVTDAANPARRITVDNYTVVRERKKFSAASWTTLTPYQITNASAIVGTTITWADTDVDDHDTDLLKWVYRYSIKAGQCSSTSAASPTVEHPTCASTFNSLIQASGELSGGNGLTAATPWVMNAGDTVEARPTGTNTFAKVDFQLFPLSSSTQVVESYVAPVDPYVYGWSDKSDGETFRLLITMTDSAGCIQQAVRYIYDQVIGCTFTGSATTATGAARGDGLTRSSAWLMNAGDTVRLAPPSGRTFTQVVFDLYDGIQKIKNDVQTSGFTTTWIKQQDDVIYELIMTATDNFGCVETVTRYIQDQPCAFSGSVVTANTGTPGSGSFVSPWIMDANDTVTVTAPTPTVLQSVRFELYDDSVSTGTPTNTVTVTQAPFRYTWTDRIDNRLYRLEIRPTNSSGCIDPRTVYIKDQVTLTPCTLSATGGAITNTTQGQTTTATVTYNLTNTSSELLTLSDIQVDWADAARPTARLTTLIYTYAPSTASQTVATANQPQPSTGTLAVVANAPTVPTSGTYTLQIRFTFPRSTGNMTTNPISKLCIGYTAPTHAGVPKHCNVVGRAATTQNPNSCD